MSPDIIYFGISLLSPLSVWTNKGEKVVPFFFFFFGVFQVLTISLHWVEKKCGTTVPAGSQLDFVSLYIASAAKACLNERILKFSWGRCSKILKCCLWLRPILSWILPRSILYWWSFLQEFTLSIFLWILGIIHLTKRILEMLSIYIL